MFFLVSVRFHFPVTKKKEIEENDRGSGKNTTRFLAQTFRFYLFNAATTMKNMIQFRNVIFVAVGRSKAAAPNVVTVPLNFKWFSFIFFVRARLN